MVAAYISYIGESDGGVMAANSAPIKQWFGAGDALGQTRWFMLCVFAIVHMSTF